MFYKPAALGKNAGADLFHVHVIKNVAFSVVGAVPDRAVAPSVLPVVQC